jgi:hypothetical protein
MGHPPGLRSLLEKTICSEQSASYLRWVLQVAVDRPAAAFKAANTVTTYLLQQINCSQPGVAPDFLIYAHDVDAKEKHVVAKDALSALWAERTGVLSMQVLQEFYVNVTRKLSRPLMKKAARAVGDRYALWCIDTRRRRSPLPSVSRPKPGSDSGMLLSAPRL